MPDQTSPDAAAPNDPARSGEPATPSSGRAAAPSGGRSTGHPVQYRGADLEAERGPGLGCFWLQVVVLGILVVATPVTVSLGWPSEVSAVLLFVTIGLLLLTGQTIIFLLRLVAADRRGRRRPLASATRTVGELEDAARTVDADGAAADTHRSPTEAQPSGAGADRPPTEAQPSGAGADRPPTETRPSEAGADRSPLAAAPEDRGPNAVDDVRQ